MKKLILFFFIGLNVCNGYAQNAAQSDNSTPLPTNVEEGKPKCTIEIAAPILQRIGFQDQAINGGIFAIELPISSTDDQIIAAYRKELRQLWITGTKVDNPKNCELKYDKCADEYITTEVITEVYDSGQKVAWSIAFTRRTLCPGAQILSNKCLVMFTK